MLKNSKYTEHAEFGKYFRLLVSGNAIAARLEQTIISEHTALVLFKKLFEQFEEENNNDSSIK